MAMAATAVTLSRMLLSRSSPNPFAADARPTKTPRRMTPRPLKMLSPRVPRRYQREAKISAARISTSTRGPQPCRLVQLVISVRSSSSTDPSPGGAGDGEGDPQSIHRRPHVVSAHDASPAGDGRGGRREAPVEAMPERTGVTPAVVPVVIGIFVQEAEERLARDPDHDPARHLTKLAQAREQGEVVLEALAEGRCPGR